MGNGASCVVRPTVPDNKGGFIISPLYTFLENLTGDMQKSRDIYSRITSEEGMETMTKANADFTEYNEPTARSVITHKWGDISFGGYDVKGAIARTYGFTDEKGEQVVFEEKSKAKDNEHTTNHATSKIVELNNSDWSSLYYAKAHYDDRGNLVVTIEETKGDYISVRKELFSIRMRDNLRSIMNRSNIGEDAIEEVKFNMMHEGTDSSLIYAKIADALYGFSQFMRDPSHRHDITASVIFINNLLKNSDSFRSITEHIRQKGNAYEILGDMFSDVDGAVANEFAAALEIIRHASGQQTTYKGANLLQTAWNTARVRLTALSDDEIINEIKSADKDTGVIDFVSGAFSFLRKEETESIRGSASDALERSRNIIGHLIEDMYRQYKIERERHRRHKDRKEYEEYDMDKTIQMSLNALHQSLYSRDLPEEYFGPQEIDPVRFAHVPEEPGTLSLGDITPDKINIAHVMYGIDFFLRNAITRLDALGKKMDEIRNRPDVKSKAAILREARDTLSYYASTVSYLRNEEKSALKTGNRYFDGNTIELIGHIESAISSLTPEWNEEARKVMSELADFFPDEGLTIDGRVVTKDNYFREYSKDVSMLDRFLDAASDTPDMLVKTFDKVKKNAVGTHRQKAIGHIQEVQKAFAKLKKATGSSDQSWMFQRNKDGSLRSNLSYIVPYNFEEYKKRREKVIRNAKTIAYEEDVDYLTLRTQMLDRFERENSIMFHGFRIPNYNYTDETGKRIYANEEFDNLSEPQKEFLMEMLAMKARMDSLLPQQEGFYIESAVRLRKDMSERIGGMLDNLGGNIKAIWQESTGIMPDDTEYSREQLKIKDFEGRDVKSAPVHYRKMNEDEYEQYSLDAATSMIAYIQMAENYAALNSVCGTLEIGCILANDRRFVTQRENRQLNEDNEKRIRNFVRMLSGNGDSSHYLDMLNDYMNMHVYGETKRAKTVKIANKEVTPNKLASMFNKVTALNTTALNFLGGVANVITGFAQINIEMAANEHFSGGDVLRANWTYMHNILHSLFELGRPVKTNKLDLWNELFNVQQDWEEKRDEAALHMPGLMRIGKKLLFSTNAMGEHLLSSVGAIAMGGHGSNALRTSDGTVVSLWDAYRMEQIDKGNDDAGNRLVLDTDRYGELYTSDGRKVLTKAELSRRAKEYEADSGKHVEPDSELLIYPEEVGKVITEYKFVEEFSRLSAKVNQRMHGIYNEEDKNALQQYALGNVAIMYRKWMVTSIQKRFGRHQYNFDTKGETEGYYLTGWNFAKMLLKQEEGMKRLSVKEAVGQLSKPQQANLRRMKREFFQFMFVALAAAVVEAMKDGGDGDDVEESRLFDWVDYQLVRQRAELGALTPFSFLTGKTNMLTEFLTIMQEPVTGMNVWNRYLSLPQLLFPSSYSDENRLRSGRYKGRTRAHKILWENVPLSRTMYGNFHPEERAKFYSNRRFSQ